MSDIKKIRVGGVDYNISPDLTSYAKKTDLTSYVSKTELTSYAKKTDLTGYAKKTEINSLISEVQTKEYYYNDGSNEVVPIKHPDLSTQPSILPYKFMGQYVYEQLIPVKVGDRVVSCDFEVEYPMILSAGVFGVNSFKNVVDIMAIKSNALLLSTESELDGYINIKYTDGSQLLPSSGYGYGYEDNNTESESPVLIDFGLSPDRTTYIYDPNTEVLSLYKSGEITGNSIPQNIPTKNIILGEGVTSIRTKAFEGCSSLTSITLPESVTSIGEYAFRNCSSLTNITIPESVTSIGKGAFDGTTWYNDQPDGVVYVGKVLYMYKGTMSANTSVEVKEGTISIGNRAFYGCKKLANINIPESVTSIGDEAFEDCDSLTDVTIPEGVMSIGKEAFWDCANLTSITIPESVTRIGISAFDWCHKLKAVHISSIETWCKISFANNLSNPLCYAYNLYLNGELLTQLTIPESVTSIGKWVFRNCRSLTSINIPESVTRIENSAFSGCRNLTAVTIPESVTSIEYEAFSDCSSLTSISVDENNLVYDSRENCNAIVETSSNTLIQGCPSTLIPESITSIGDRAFSSCKLTNITIGEGVTSIGGSAFSGSSLTSITIPEGVTSIGSSAFSGCFDLISVTIPKSVTSIGSNAFYNCFDLDKVINYSNKSVGVTNINVTYKGSQLTTVGDYQFYTSDGIHLLVNYIGNNTEIVLPDSYNGENYKIGDCAFAGFNLTSVNIPDGQTSIGYAAFKHCRNLAAITIPEGVTSIGISAFYGCSSLTSITLPESVTSIENATFRECTKLADINIPESMTSIGDSAFYDCISLSTINIPESVTTIEGWAFRGCSKLTTITLPEGITSIGEVTFCECHGLTSITIPENVTSIGRMAFENCKGLTSITSKAITPPSVLTNTFNKVNKSIPVYVPAESVDAYKAANVWKDFTKIQAI